MNNISEENYGTMLASFRPSDLQRLLEAFGQNKVGRRVELRNRALELLRSRPIGFSYEAYLSKILEIYNYKESRMSNNFMQPQQGQTMYMGQMQIPQQRMNPLLQYSPQQPMHTTRAGLPQFLIRVPRPVTGQNIYFVNNVTNNNIRCALSSSNQPSGPHTTISSLLPLNQQNSVRLIVNALASINNNVLNSSQTVDRYKFKKLPFFEVIDNIIETTFLIGSENCTLEKFTKGTKECVFTHTMTVEQASLIAMNRDISYGKEEYLFQYQIRFCQLEFGRNSEVTDYFPPGLHIRIGNRTCPLPSNISIKLGTESRRIARPINISHYLKLNPMLANSITVNWIPDGKKYAIALFIVKKLSSDDLIKKLQEKEARSSEETKNNIIKKLAVSDSDFAPTSYRFSLVCPLGKIRMKIPAKSIHCDHIQCFDAETFILMNEKKPQWMCPTCNKSCLYDDIRIENYFMEIVTSPKLENNMEIEILADGSWIVFKENKDTKNTNSNLDSKTNPIDAIDLDDSDNEISIEPKKEFLSEVSEKQESENLKSDFVDLTLDENKKPSDNEVQAAHVIQPVTDAIQSMIDTMQPITDAIQPITDAIQPMTNTLQPVTDIIQPITDTIQLVTDTIQPVPNAT
ncbi:E3 SUMO-protein ligase PIAS1-like [Melanaphis sacchari]|uniref:E3 SUMO-protein ligase PIAS1-like n=1 Tax=Melanaphis sacchari TaxID=742174 RepID=UPI000DC13D9B|nr:E3 SUMO-protein ligase PIAS1-like [Melanaphis sacchari]